MLPSRTPRLGWLAPLLAVSLVRAQPSAGPEPDINFDSWAKEFEASEATRPLSRACRYWRRGCCGRRGARYWRRGWAG